MSNGYFAVFKACGKCPHKKECLEDGKPDELNLRHKANRLGGIHIPKGCPLKEGSSDNKELFVFR